MSSIILNRLEYAARALETKIEADRNEVLKASQAAVDIEPSDLASLEMSSILIKSANAILQADETLLKAIKAVAAKLQASNNTDATDLLLSAIAAT